MSQHQLTPDARYAEYRIAVGWDRPRGTFYAQVINVDSEPTEPRWQATATALLCRLAAILHLPARWRPTEPVFIWLGADDAILDPAEVIDAVAPYAIIPPNLENTLTLDQLVEGSRRYRP